MNFVLLENSISWWQALILGILQGLAEFLPISSSGHLELAENLMGLYGLPRIFDVCLHIGTLAAVLLVFGKDIISIIKNPKQKLTLMILAATVPTVIIAVLFEVLLDDMFSYYFLGYGFMITGILLYTMEVFSKRKVSEDCKCKDLETMTVLDAAVVGCVQGCATLPGLSRSGSTISGGVFAGLDRKFLAKFSFLMSIPAILGAFCWDLLKFFLHMGDYGEIHITVFPLILGMVSAFTVGYVAIRWMLKLISDKSFKPFAVYVFILGFIVCLTRFIR